MNARRTNKTVDSVRLMRRIRDRLSERFNKMSLEEQQQYIDEQLALTGVTPKVRSRKHRKTA